MLIILTCWNIKSCWLLLLHITSLCTVSDVCHLALMSRAQWCSPLNLSLFFGLQLDNGYLQYKYQCQGIMTKNLLLETMVNDGTLHSIILEVTAKFAKFHVDSIESELPLPDCSGHSSHLFIGALIQESDYVSQGFQGCLDDISINGQAVESMGQSIQQKGTSPCCDHNHACKHNPCPSERMCAEMPNGAYACLCHSPFPGPNCVMGTNPCATSSCSHGRICSPMSNGFTCSCPPGYQGDR
ncbi:hypothetical protein AB205_0214390 [Aquarana catesbeiana]|uniref:EGF-like domain-containing protein n=1 Tax=Aquarana catesbeiana TaxID=8400 RepID=A0A2G9R771_AQUCT|nr:hypothetical protein AB205_0214390 [Aquarana catesbeiana]